jgi:hypothetical protein
VRDSRKPEVRSQKPGAGWGGPHRPALLFTTGYWLLATGFFFITPGCADDPPANDPTQKAMQDPMHYKPEFERRDAADENRNQQDGLGKDLDHVLNP